MGTLAVNSIHWFFIHWPGASPRFNALPARFRHKATGNLGKLLKEAAAAKARYAVILGDEVRAGNAAVKNLDTQAQIDVALADLDQRIGR